MFKKGIFWLLGGLLFFAQYCYADLVDPTAPPVGYNAVNAQTLNSPLTLMAIFTSHERNMAVINGQFLEVGASIENYQITQITSQAVFLQGPTGAISLPLVDRSVKTPVTNKGGAQ